MRRLSEGLAAHLESGATTLCHVWRLSLADGRQFGFTDHDRDIEFEGLTCRPGSGLTPGENEDRLGLSAKASSSLGALSDEVISASDIRAGLYDQAKLELYKVNWAEPESRVHLSTGWLGDISWTGAQFEAEWRGPAHGLSRTVGRVFSRYCDAEFGDARCGLNKADFPEGAICPRTLAACQEQFSNSLNFRGHPFLIGDDAMTAAPKQGEIRDGGSRYKA